MTKSLYDIIHFISILSNNDDQTLINITSVNITLLKTMIREFFLNKSTEVSLHFHFIPCKNGSIMEIPESKTHKCAQSWVSEIFIQSHHYGRTETSKNSTPI